MLVAHLYSFNEVITLKLNSLEAQLHSFKGASVKFPVVPKTKSKALDSLRKIKQAINNQDVVS